MLGLAAWRKKTKAKNNLFSQTWIQNGSNGEKKHNKIIKKLNSGCVGIREGPWSSWRQPRGLFWELLSLSLSLAPVLQVEYLYSLVYQALDFISNKK